VAGIQQLTQPPGADGGLLNPISHLMLTVLAIAIGTPIGIAGREL